MYTNEEIEIMLWNYIDGSCTGTEKLAVQELIATDRLWQERYEQLLRLHEEMHHTQTEQPSMRFTKNVMESIAAADIARPAKTYVNKWIVRSIAAFFIITLLIVVITAMGSLGSSIDFSDNQSLMPAFLKNIRSPQLFTSGTFMFIIAASTIAALAFLDTYRSRIARLKHMDRQ